MAAVPLTPQYDPKSLYTDGCTSAACQATLAAPNSLPQGRTFLEMSRNLHGGRRTRRASRKDRKSRRASRKDRKDRKDRNRDKRAAAQMTPSPTVRPKAEKENKPCLWVWAQAWW